MHARLRDCAVSQAADAAVAARVPAISARVSPAALAAHVAGAMRQAISDGTRACEPEEPQYLAPPYRWALVRDVLRAAGTARGATRAAASGNAPTARRSPGATSKDQLAAVTRWYARDQRDAQAVATVIWGTRPRTAIEQAVGCRVGDPGWPVLLAGMLAAFTKTPWPRALLRRSPPRAQATGKQAGMSGCPLRHRDHRPGHQRRALAQRGQPRRRIRREPRGAGG